MRNQTIEKTISGFSQLSQVQEEKLKEIALQEMPQIEPLNQPGRRVKPKKKK